MTRIFCALCAAACLSFLAGGALLPLAARQEKQEKPAPAPQEQEMDRLFQESVAFYNSRDFPAAERLLRAGLEKAQSLSDERRIALFLNSLGSIRLQQEQWVEALEFYQRALVVYEKLGDVKRTAMTLTNVGLAHTSLEQFTQALESHHRALALFEKIQSPREIAISLNYIGDVHQNIGQYDQALALYNRAYALNEPMGDPQEIAKSLNNLGNAHLRLGDYEKSLDFYKRALALREKDGDPLEVAWFYNNLGVVYEHLSQYDLALEFGDRALALREKANVLEGIAASLNNLGGLYFHIGQWDKAEAYHTRALNIARQQEDTSLVSASLSGLGVVVYRQGRLREAMAFHERALALDEKRGVSLEIAHSLDNIGLVYMDLREWEKSEDYLNRALVLNEKYGSHQEIAGSLNNLGALSARRGDFQKALHFYSRSLKLKPPHENTEDLALTLGNIADVYRLLGEFEKAEDAYRRAINFFEALDEQIGDPTGLGAYQEAKQTSLYAGYAALLMARKRPTDALAMAERGRTQGLARQTAQNRIELAVLFSAEDATQWKTASEDLTRAARLLSAARTRDESAIPVEKQTAHNDLAAAQKRFEAAERRLSILRTSLTRRYPDFRRLHGTEPPTFARLKALADRSPDTLFLEWATVDDTRTLCFALSEKGGLRTFTLPDSKEKLGDLTRRWKSHLTALADPRKDKVAAVAGETQTAQKLYRVLMSPLEKSGLLKPGLYRRLVIVPDGPLLDIPFAALLDNKGKRLIESYALSIGLSLDLLTWPDNPRKPSAGLLCFADPAGEGGAILRSATRGKFGALPAARKETRTLIAHFPNAQGFFGKDAQEQEFKRLAGGSALLHFATHGSYDGRDGKRSFLVLAAGGGEDGFLEAREILGLKLSARLATLSACETAQGQRSGGEGLVGLTWAFRAAGCPSVVASQWKVDDAATGKLMTRFYDELKQGRRKDDALRTAMLAIRKEPFRSPAYYWAAFQIMGDTAPLFPPPGR